MLIICIQMSQNDFDASSAFNFILHNIFILYNKFSLIEGAIASVEKWA